MSKRLQVLLDELEWREIQRAARTERMTVALSDPPFVMLGAPLAVCTRVFAWHESEVRLYGVAEWVRQALRAARRAVSTADVDQKLAAIRIASRHEFPTAVIEQMNAEIVRGYVGRRAT